MSRPVLLFSAPWIDMPLEQLAARAAEWGYQGLELYCMAEHLEVQQALADSTHCSAKLEIMSRHDLQLPVITSYGIGHAVCSPHAPGLKPLLPDYVWGNGEPAEIQQRAAEEMTATIHVAQALGAVAVGCFSGSPFPPATATWPELDGQTLAEGFRAFARWWNPILDACAEAGVRVALEVHPSQIANDFYSAEMVLDAVHGREELGFLFDASNLHWIGVDPVEFLHRFGDRIFHVHVKDVALTLNGRSSVLNSCVPTGDARRGWDFRSPGHGGLDWEGIIRALNAIGYAGPLSVDWRDAGMDREFGAEDACKFIKKLDFAPAPSQDAHVFH